MSRKKALATILKQTSKGVFDTIAICLRARTSPSFDPAESDSLGYDLYYYAALHQRHDITKALIDLGINPSSNLMGREVNPYNDD